jgi:hypothetical protein
MQYLGKKFFISAFIAQSLLSYSAYASINYIEVERVATAVTCQINQNTCIDYEQSQKTKSTVFEVDGIILPSDALKDADQQRAMLAANLYIQNNGEVKPLPDLAQVKAQNDEIQQQISERNKSLPITRFPAPVISGNQGPVILKTSK